MAFAIRVVVMLAAVVPLFAATAFRPVWWQALVAATIGAGLGQLAARVTRGRRAAGWSIAVVALAIAGVGFGRPYVRVARHDPPPSRLDHFVVEPIDDQPASVTLDDARAIRTDLPSVALVVPYLSKSAHLTSDAQNWATTVVGTTPEYFELRHQSIAIGSPFAVSAVESGERVVVLGETTAARLFDTAEVSVGQTIRIESKPFTIVGVLAHQGIAPGGQDLDDTAVVPLAAYMVKLATTVRFGGALLVSARSSDDTARTLAELRSLLRDRHRLGPNEPDDFTIRAPADGGGR